MVGRGRGDVREKTGHGLMSASVSNVCGTANNIAYRCMSYAETQSLRQDALKTPITSMGQRARPRSATTSLLVSYFTQSATRVTVSMTDRKQPALPGFNWLLIHLAAEQTTILKEGPGRAGSTTARRPTELQIASLEQLDWGVWQ